MEKSLTQLANDYGSDKGDVHKDAHHYTRVYDHLFEKRRQQPVRILEIGLLHPGDVRWVDIKGTPHNGDSTGSAAPSLSMWADYFPQGEIHGFDLNDFSSVRLPRVTIHRGDSSSREDLRRLAAQGPFDIIIDDASHASSHQQIALSELFDAVKPGGLYIVEDMHYQHPDLESDATPKTRAVFYEYQRHGQLSSPHIDAETARRIESGLSDLMLFDTHSENYIVKGRDALAVLWRRA